MMDERDWELNELTYWIQWKRWDDPSNRLIDWIETDRDGMRQERRTESMVEFEWVPVFIQGERGGETMRGEGYKKWEESQLGDTNVRQSLVFIFIIRSSLANLKSILYCGKSVSVGCSNAPKCLLVYLKQDRLGNNSKQTIQWVHSQLSARILLLIVHNDSSLFEYVSNILVSVWKLILNNNLMSIGESYTGFVLTFSVFFIAIAAPAGTLFPEELFHHTHWKF